MQLKGQDMAVKGGALAVAREILAVRRAEQQLDESAPPPAGPPAAPASAIVPSSNPVIEEWRRRQVATGER